MLGGPRYTNCFALLVAEVLSVGEHFRSELDSIDYALALGTAIVNPTRKCKKSVVFTQSLYYRLMRFERSKVCNRYFGPY